MSTWLYLPTAMAFVVGTKFPLAVAMYKHGKGRYDNRNPREQQAHLDGWGSRAKAAHYNTIEAFPFFAAGFLAAQLGNGSPLWTHILCAAWFFARIVYLWAYLRDVATLRTLIWSVGFFASIGLSLLPMFSP